MIETCHIDEATMASRVARFKALRPLPVQRDQQLSLAALDIVYARQLLSVFTYTNSTSQALKDKAVAAYFRAAKRRTAAACSGGLSSIVYSASKSFCSAAIMSPR